MPKSKTLCLVTGGAGFIGSHVADELLRRRFRVRILDNMSAGKIENIEAMRGDLDFIKGDVRNEKDVRKSVKNTDYVFHLAADRAVEHSVDDPLATNEVNVTGTLRLLLAARDEKIKRFIFTSSSAIYGETRKFPSLETDLPMPASPYGASKIMGEYYCKEFSNLYGLETVSLRYFNVFGPRQNPESRYSAVIPIFIECLSRQKSPHIHWDGKQSRDFIYVDNVVHSNMLAMTKAAAVGEVFNVACDEEYSILDIFNALKKIMQIQGVKPVFTPKRPGDVRRTYADITKIKRRLGFKVQTHFYEGLEKTAAWFLSKNE
jgi:nucleoside-diphosphate-sugar epimerase